MEKNMLGHEKKFCFVSIFADFALCLVNGDPTEFFRLRKKFTEKYIDVFFSGVKCIG